MRGRTGVASLFAISIVAISLVALSTVPSAGASPRPQLRAPDSQFSLPSSVCSVITPIHETNALDILGDLLDDDRYSVLGAILFAASALGCGKAEEQSLLVAQSSLAQAVANDIPKFRSFAADLGKVVPSLRQRAGPAVAEFAFPTVSLSTGAVGTNSLVPVTVRWLQVGGAAAERVDIEARIFLTATSATPWQVVTSGLSDLAPGTGLLNAHSVSLALRGDTYWELCIRASSSGLFAPYACGWRFTFRRGCLGGGPAQLGVGVVGERLLQLLRLAGRRGRRRLEARRDLLRRRAGGFVPHPVRSMELHEGGPLRRSVPRLR